MTTRNTSSLSAIQERIVRGQLASLLLQHHGDIVTNGIGQAVHATHQHLRLLVVLEGALADRTRQDLQHVSAHRRHPLVNAASPVLCSTRWSNSRSCVSPNCATIGTYQSCELAKSRHFTASFSVMSTGSVSPNSRSCAAKG